MALRRKGIYIVAGSAALSSLIGPSEPSVIRIHPRQMVNGRTYQRVAKRLLRTCCIILIASVPIVASAESLRCNGQSVSEGDTA